MIMVNTLAMVYIIDIIFYYSTLYYTSVFLIDINECTEDTHSCDGNASCTNIIGSYNCSCNFGFEGDGLNCTGVYTFIETYHVQTDIIFYLHSFIHYLQYLMFVSILVLWTAMSMLTVWTLWEVMSVTVLQDTLEMEHTAQVRRVLEFL